MRSLETVAAGALGASRFVFRMGSDQGIAVVCR